MRPIFRILHPTIVLLSLFLCIAAADSWVRSYWETDSITLSSSPKWSLSTTSGTLHLTRDQPWLEPQDLKRGIISKRKENSLLGFGRYEEQDQRVWQGSSGRKIDYITNIRSYFVPIWFCFAIFSILPAIYFSRFFRRIRRRNLNLCLHCGYDLRASPAKCPECGAATPKNQNKKASLPAPR